MFSQRLRIIRILALFAFALSILSIGWEVASDYNQAVKEEQSRLAAIAKGEPVFGIYGDWGDSRRWKRMILIPLSLFAYLCIRRYQYLSLITYGISIGILLIWLQSMLQAISISSVELSDKRLITIALLAANPFDYSLFATLLILFPSVLGQLLYSRRKETRNMGDQS